MNIVNMLIMALMTFALLDELFLWIRYRQLRQETREAAERSMRHHCYEIEKMRCAFKINTL